jgi:hypothetical protein
LGPTAVHYAALGLSFVAILWIGRDQWFFGDDWAILVPRNDGALLTPHMGHWNLVPALVFPLVRNWLGLASYLPFLALAVLAHIAVAHLVWRILRRIGVTGWVSTLFSVFVMMLGAGAENLLWAFQFGFMGAIALGLAVVVLVDRPRPWPVLAVAAACAVVAPAFSGTAIPVLAAAAIVAWVRCGFLRTLALFAPSAIVYLSWYLLVAREHAVVSGGVSTLSDVPGAVLYAAAMLGGGLGRALPWIGLGVVPALAVAIWFFVTLRKGFVSSATPAYALVVGAVVFAGLTAFSRSGLGLSAAASQRYAYVVIVLLVPALGILLGRLAERARWSFATVAAVLCATIAFNTALLVYEAQLQAAREAASESRVLATLDAVVANPEDEALIDATADSQWAPDLLGSDLLWLAEAGQLSP